MVNRKLFLSLFLGVLLSWTVGLAQTQGGKRYGVLTIDPAAGEKFLRETGIVKLEALGGRDWLVSLTPDSPLNGKLEPLSLKQKLSPELQGETMPLWAQVRLRGDVAGLELLVYFQADLDADYAQNQLDTMGATVLDRSDAFGRLMVRVPEADLKRLAAQDWVRMVEPTFPPLEFRANADSARQMRVEEMREASGLRGSGARVAVVDGQVDQHPEFSGRLTQFRSGPANSHGTHVAGTVAAAGNDPRLKGMVPEARITSYSLTSINDGIAWILGSKTLDGLDLATNSGGARAAEVVGTCSLMGQYTSFDREVDRIVAENNYPVVFAIGNTRNQYDCNMPTRAGFYTIPPPGSAKNILTVGAVDRENATSTFSSFGPTRDGRVKPEVVGLGVSVLSTGLNGGTATLSGTSMSAPAVSGLAALLIERYKGYHGVGPEPELLKAVLANTANDLGNPGVDYSYGYGIPDAVKALEVIDGNRFFRDGIWSHEFREYGIDVPGGAPDLRVMLAWTDPPASFNADNPLIHDLDLELVSPGGETKLPLTLDPFRPAADAQPGMNHRDNIEQVVVHAPESGRWTIRVKSQELPVGMQRFAVVWSVAENPAPPCRTTVFPNSLFGMENEATALIQVARSSICEPWGVEELPDWMTRHEAAPESASATAKILVAANESGSQRAATLRVAGVPVTIRQNSKCIAEEIPVGERIFGSLSDTDCAYLNFSNFYAKHYKFEAKAGQRLVAEAASIAIDTYILILGPGGIYVGEDDDGGTGLNSRFPAGSGSVALPLDGEYTLVVSSALSRQTGSFSAQVTLGEAEGSNAALPKVIEACPVELEGEITPDSSREGRRGDLYRTDIYFFEGRVGQTIRAAVPESTFDAVLYLIGPNGSQIAFADDSFESPVPVIERVLTMNGIYRLEVTSFAPFQTGRYVLEAANCEEWVRR